MRTLENPAQARKLRRSRKRGCGELAIHRPNGSVNWWLARHGWAHLSTSAWSASPGSGRLLLFAALLLLGLAGALAARADTAPATEVLDVEPVELLSAEALAALVAPVALYPDDLLAIVLPAATFPVQVVLAKRFLEAREANPDLTPDETWDASIVALLNYPEVLALLYETWRGPRNSARRSLCRNGM